MFKLPARRLRAARADVLGSRIARLIFLSNLAGLAILIIGAMVLNEMRASFVVSKKEDLVGQAQLLSNIIADAATDGTPKALLNRERARDTLEKLALPLTLRGKVFFPDGKLVGDSYFLSRRVIISNLPPLKEPGRISRFSQTLSQWAVSVLQTWTSKRGGDAIQVRSYGAEFRVALNGEDAASQRFNDRGQRIISVSVPIQVVSSVVGILTLESNDIDAIIRAERMALIPFIAVAILVAMITSTLLTLGIARPLRRLATATDAIRSGRSQKLALPALTQRRDEIGTLAQSVEAMTAALFERIEANEAFAADVAHELKNPLTSIRSAVETAARVRDDPQAVEKLRVVITKDVQRLDRLITDISNASRLEAEMSRIPAERINLTRLVRDVVTTYEDLKHPRDVHLQFLDKASGHALFVRGREGPLGQVLRNLIDNALSFSPQGGVVIIEVSGEMRSGKTFAFVRILDQGPGIPDDKLTKIFERFYTDRPEGAAFGNNSGLGLSIVSQIVAAHGGTVEAQNRAGGGAVFSVGLPI